MLRVAAVGAPALPARRAPAARAAVVTTATRSRFEPPSSRRRARRATVLHTIEQLTALPALLARGTTPQRMLGASLTGSLLLLLFRWQAVLRAATPPALALAAFGWLFAHDSRAALEEDLLLLLHPERPRRSSANKGGNGIEAFASNDLEDNAPAASPAEDPWDRGFKRPLRGGGDGGERRVMPADAMRDER